jgi:hypothetical protein
MIQTILFSFFPPILNDFPILLLILLLLLQPPTTPLPDSDHYYR